MRFYTYFKTASYLLVFSAFISLATTDDLEPVYVAIVVLGLAAGLLQERFDLSLLSRAILVLSIPFLTADFFIISRDILLAFTHLLIFLTIARLLSLRIDNDFNQLYLLTFFDLLAASALTINLSFAFTFTLYLVSATWALLLFHLKKEVEEQVLTEKERALEETVTVPFFLSIGGIAVLSLVITLVIFFVLPRVGIGLFSKKPGKVLKTSGFADKVDFGQIGPVTLDPATVMRVELPDVEKGMGSIYLRGAALDSFNGTTWEKERGKLRFIRGDGSDFNLSEGAGPLVRQEIILDPLDSKVIFGMSRMVRLSGRFQSLSVDRDDTVSLPFNPSSRFQYTAYSDVARPTAAELDADNRPYPSETLGHYTKTPPLPERVKELASSVTADAKGTYRKVKAVDTYLKKNYSYTLDPKRDESLPPVEDFLFKNREGYCDHFSTAMTLLLRELRIPTRLVTGYVTSEWNDLGRFYTARQRNAHSWVEVYFPSYGWIPFDPTPSAAPVVENLTVASITRYIAYIRLKWDRYIINFSLQDQVKAAKETRRRTEIGRDALMKLVASLKTKAGVVWKTATIFAAAVIIFYFAIVKMWHAMGRGPISYKRGTVPFYQEMLRILAKRGLIKPDAMTPREYAGWIMAEKGESYSGVKEVTRAFEQVRYGGMPLDPDKAESVNKAIEGLRKG